MNFWTKLLLGTYVLCQAILFVFGLALITHGLPEQACSKIHLLQDEVFPVKTRGDWLMSHFAVPGVLLARNLVLSKRGCHVAEWWQTPLNP